MAVVPGGAKLCTRRNFNSNVASYFTNDDKVLTRREVGIGSFVVGNYKYTLSSTVTNLDTCMTCGNITYTKTENDPTITYLVSFNNVTAQPNYVRDNGEWTNIGGGQCEAYCIVHFTFYDINGSTLYDEDVTATIRGEIEARQIYVSEVSIPAISISTKKSKPLSSGEVDYRDRPIIGISSSRYFSTSDKDGGNVSWNDICFELES
jgi:hypothetical protein